MSDESEQSLKEQELIAVHKKERKDLQAKIQCLKKTICKGDKKKKKEITEEIVKLESELEKKQNDDLAELKLSQMNLSVSENEKNDETVSNDISTEISDQGNSKPARVSKAQKRREKKENAEKERNERIIEQEALNEFGQRNLEIQAIKTILTKRNLMVHEIPSDGHCLYNAVAHQLKLIGDLPLDYNDLRKKTANHLRENIDSFLPFIENSNSTDDELMTVEQYEKYCDNVAETSAWGGAVELQVLSSVLKCPIEVIQAIGAPYEVGTEFEPTRKLILTYYRHMYQLGAHYNSVTKYVPNTEDS
ncbi:OTU domain-containing protein 6B [Copidosoma floridanum]|uniref:OTU domain-containing protein 6B n=1 Tax=Copidosoma floridanum TaxID=29053 RepID=UPI0006C9A314|nr:OTU domain-containing protein 6B [Copidosoma floridanum]